MNRGISCTMYNNSELIREVLILLSENKRTFYIAWYNAIGKEHSLLPVSSENHIVSGNKLKDMAKATIWDMVLQIYPPNKKTVESFRTYEDYQNSSCVCCLIYCDCGDLDIYMKEPELFKKVQNLLMEHHVENFEVLTDENDRREILHIF